MTLLDRHLSGDDLDTLLDRTAAREVMVHLETCGACRDLAALDGRVVRALEGAPRFSPSAAFTDRVMARVTVQKAARSTLRLPWIGRIPVARAASAGLVLGGAILASILWSLANRDLLDAWGSQALAQVGEWAWLGLRTMAASLAAQPWYGTVREFLGTPARLALAVTVLVAGYAAGVLALKRLIALPSRPVPHALG